MRTKGKKTQENLSLLERFERKVFHLSEITLILIIATLTLLGICSIFYLGRKEVLYKETPTYVITVDDPVCKCEIAYESRYYLFKKKNNKNKRRII